MKCNDSIILSDLSLRYLKPIRFAVIDKLSVIFPMGKISVILGPSGSGKSTLLRIICGLLPDFSSEISGNIQRPERNLTIAFQEDALLPWKNVENNICLPLTLAGIQQKQILENIIAMMGLADFRHYKPHQLSAGMKKRVSLGRALITEPEWLLLDEPFGALDAVTRYVLASKLLSIQRQSRCSIILVTHDVVEAIILGDTVYKFNGPPLELMQKEQVKPSDIPWDIVFALLKKASDHMPEELEQAKITELKAAL